jgi:hypothetical protein
LTGTVTLGGDLLLPAGFNPTGAQFVPLIVNDGIDPVVDILNGLPDGASLGTINGFNVQIFYPGNFDGGAVGNDVFLRFPNHRQPV